MATMPAWRIAAVSGRGRSVLATRALPAGAIVMESTPLAQVVKGESSATCRYCVAPLRRTAGASPFCSARCEAADSASGGALLARCDLSPLHELHARDGRKFPLLAASLLAALLEGLRASRKPHPRWEEAMGLCYADLHPDAAEQLSAEREHIVRAFADARVSTRDTLEMLLPAERYARILGAAQLNAFSLTTLGGARLSALLGGGASYFNHDCAPNLDVANAHDHVVRFVTRAPVHVDEELTISYVDTDAATHAEHRELFETKYGFTCECSKCRGLAAAG